MHFPLSNLRQLPALLLASSLLSALALPTDPTPSGESITIPDSGFVPNSLPDAALLSRTPVHDPYPNDAAVAAAYIGGSQPSVFFSNTGASNQDERNWPDTFANQIGGRTFRMAFPDAYCDRRSGPGGRTAYGAFAVRFSTVLAQKATGTAYVLMRDDPDGPHPNSVWAKYERPALEAGRVDKIVKVEPGSFRQSDLWVRGAAKRDVEVVDVDVDVDVKRDVPDGREYVLDWDAPADGPYWLAPDQ